MPPERLKISEWAERYRVLSPESSVEYGDWKNARVPYMVDVMNAINDPETEEITIQSSSQTSKTEAIIINPILYYMDKEPSPILLLCPTLNFAENFSRKRLTPAIRDCKSLQGKISTNSRDAANTLLYKEFHGGNITLAGSNSPATLSSHPIRIFLVEELDRTETTSEGDSVALGEKRTNNYYNRKKIKVSTPTLKGLSKIVKTYERGSREQFYVECPHCKAKQTLKFSQVIFKNSENKTDAKCARYRCEKCSQDWTEAHRYEAIKSGLWIAEKPENKRHRSFKINELYSLWRSLEQIVTDFLEKKDNPETLQVFVNTTLGEEFEIKGQAPDWQKLHARREKYNAQVPNRCVFLVGGVDVQEDRIQIEVVGWGRNFENWSIEYQTFFGDTASKEPWDKLEKYLEKTFKCEDGREIGILKVCIDANYNSQDVLKFCRKYYISSVIPIVGRDRQLEIIAPPRKIDVKGKKKYGSFRSYTVGSSTIKKEVYNALRQEKKIYKIDNKEIEAFPFGYCHFPENYNESYFMELTAEEAKKKKDKNGFFIYYWEKIRERNEALDCRVYSRAAAYIVGMDFFTEEDWERKEQEQPGGIKKRTFVHEQVERNNDKDLDSFEDFWES